MDGSVLVAGETVRFLLQICLLSDSALGKFDLCRIAAVCEPKVAPHILQANGFSPVWTRMWMSSTLEWGTLVRCQIQGYIFSISIITLKIISFPANTKLFFSYNTEIWDYYVYFFPFPSTLYIFPHDFYCYLLPRTIFPPLPQHYIVYIIYDTG